MREKFNVGIISSAMADPGQAGSSRLILGFTGLLVILVFTDIFGANPSEVSAHKEVLPPPNFAKLMAGPSIKFLYWYVLTCCYVNKSIYFLLFISVFSK